jgi:hypothetical protein
VLNDLLLGEDHWNEVKVKTDVLFGNGFHEKFLEGKLEGQLFEESVRP